MSAFLFGDLGDEQTYGPTAEHNHLLSGADTRPGNVMAGDRQGLYQGTLPEGDLVRQPVQGARLDCPRMLQGPGGINSHEIKVVTDMAMSGQTRRAFSAVVERANHNMVTYLEPLHVASEFGDDARHLMAYDLWRPHPSVHDAVIYVHVGSTDAHEADIETNFVRARSDARAGDHIKGFVL